MEAKEDFLETEEFYNLLQDYRNATWINQKSVIDAYEAIKTYIRKEMEAKKDGTN